MENSRGLLRWWVYQKERFPLAQYVPMVFAFSFCAVSYSAHLREGNFSWIALVVAFVSSLVFFMLLRIADEFKDREDDARYRPYRPVPRGLVKLSELALIGVALVALQVIVAAFYEPRLLVYLAIVWLFFALMSKEFFVATWLKRHPTLYLISHMMIMPLIDLFATACDWLIVGEKQYPAVLLIGFLAASFFNGAVIEIGRKIRAYEAEEIGVETYTAIWGNRRAVFTWLAVLSGALLTALVAAHAVGVLLAGSILLIVMFLICLYYAISFINTPTVPFSKMIERLSGLWTMVVYVSLATLPFFV